MSEAQDKRDREIATAGFLGITPPPAKPGEPSLAYLERLVLEVRERLERLEKRMEKARAPE